MLDSEQRRRVVQRDGRQLGGGADQVQWLLRGEEREQRAAWRAMDQRTDVEARAAVGALLVRKAALQEGRQRVVDRLCELVEQRLSRQLRSQGSSGSLQGRL